MTTTSSTGLIELAALKQGARATWAAGDYPQVARRELWAIGERIVAAAGVHDGDDVLDVACGSGNAALRAARAGARVTGLDLTPELLHAGQQLAARDGLSVDWVQGDAEDLPFDDASFDVVVSTFGVMFAPRHAVVAAELARVLRPGGRLALANWTPTGSTGAMFALLGSHLPAPSPIADPPLLWGTVDHVRELLHDSGIALRFTRDVAPPSPFATGAEAVDFAAANFGPLMMVRELTEARGQWAALRSELEALYERDEPKEYLTVLGHKESR